MPVDDDDGSLKLLTHTKQLTNNKKTYQARTSTKKVPGTTRIRAVCTHHTIREADDFTILPGTSPSPPAEEYFDLFCAEVDEKGNKMSAAGHTQATYSSTYSQNVYAAIGLGGQHWHRHKTGRGHTVHAMRLQRCKGWTRPRANINTAAAGSPVERTGQTRGPYPRKK